MAGTGLAFLACIACGGEAGAGSLGPEGTLREMGRASAGIYADCRREARYAVDMHPQVPEGGSVPVALLSRVRGCAARGRALVSKEMPALREATAAYPRAVGYLRDWQEAYGRALDRIEAEAGNPRATGVSDASAEIAELIDRAAGEIRW